ncbi:MAG TPA: choice-of-anchor P family protein [Nocardioides sp.]|nr:choice-of-anchor P family protein [Nocardioides sp.]
MKIKRHLAPVAGALLLVTGVASLALLGGGGAASAAGSPSSAFGIELVAGGTNVIPQTPAVVSSDGSEVTDALIALPDNPLLTGGVVNVKAKNGAASSSVADLHVGAGLLQQVPQLADLGTQLKPLCDALNQIPLGQISNQIIDPQTGTLLPQLLQPIVANVAPGLDLSAITALDLSKLLPAQLGDLCNFVASGNLLGAGVVEASCTGQDGSIKVEGLTGLVGSLIDTNKPNQSIAIPGLLTVTVDRETKNADGTFTVDAVYLNLADQLELTIASATCGEVDAASPTPDESDAPSPTPIKSHAPVTG